MRIRALVIDTGRELLYRKTLLFYFGIVTLTHLVLLLALQTDGANGLITSVSLFGLEGRAGGGGFQMDNRGVPGGLAIDALRGAGVSITGVRARRASLEEVFVKVVREGEAA